VVLQYNKMPEVSLDRAGPVNDNRVGLAKRAKQGGDKKGGGMVHGAGKGVPNEGRPSRQPEATSLPGQLGILDLAKDHGKDINRGIEGIIRTTTTGADIRHKLVSGILDMADHGRKADGPVHAVTGHDATARNAGMRPIPGSPYR
jgi:hypothetical protein